MAKHSRLLPRSLALGLALAFAWLPLDAGHAAAETDDGAAGKQAPSRSARVPLTAEQERAYGSRADFFREVPERFRPDLGWRSALSPSLADAEPRWSQGFEELVIRDFFGDRREGVYVDVGCAHPRKGSTTYDLEQRLGWTGLGIDVMPRFAEPWKRLRPRSTFVQAAVADRDGEQMELHIAGPFVTLEEGLLEDVGLRDEARTLQVETATLDTLLSSHGIEKVDFLSMDIEGAELAALKGFDIQRFGPALACVETFQRDAVIAYFRRNGYELIERYLAADKFNLYFRPRSDP